MLKNVMSPYGTCDSLNQNVQFHIWSVNFKGC